MPWIKLDDDFVSHPKVRALSHEAFRLWLWGLSYAQVHGTDGYIPLDEADALAFKVLRSSHVDRHGVTSALVTAELHRDRHVFARDIERDGRRDGHAGGRDIERDGHVPEAFWDRGDFEHWLWEPVPGGYQIHDYEDYNPTKSAQARQRGQAALRQKWSRAKRKAQELLRLGEVAKARKLLAGFGESRADQVAQILAPYVTPELPTSSRGDHGASHSVTSSVTDLPRTPGSQFPVPSEDGRTGGRHEESRRDTERDTNFALDLATVAAILEAGWFGRRHSLRPDEAQLVKEWQQSGFSIDVVTAEIRRRAEALRRRKPDDPEAASLKFFASSVEAEGRAALAGLEAARAAEPAPWPKRQPEPAQGLEVWDRLRSAWLSALDPDEYRTWITPLHFQGLCGSQVAVWAPNRHFACVLSEHADFNAVAANLRLEVVFRGLSDEEEAA